MRWYYRSYPPRPKDFDPRDGHLYDGILYLPNTTTPVPIVVMIPGTRRRGSTALLPSPPAAQRSRDIPACSSIATARPLSPVVVDETVDGMHAIMGWSFGGAVALHIPMSCVESAFAAYVYGGCARRDYLLLDVPILVVMGTADTITNPEKCERFATLYPSALYPNIKVIFLEGAHHGFDKEGVDKNRRGRIMRWDAEAAAISLDRVTKFFKKHLKKGN